MGTLIPAQRKLVCAVATVCACGEGVVLPPVLWEGDSIRLTNVRGRGGLEAG